MNSSMDDSNRDLSSNLISIPPTKSRRGRKRVTDPVLAGELRRHRRSRANDRERTRMRLLNEALEHLRTLLPMDSTTYYSSTDSSMSSPSMDDKLTKIETLRTASAYIRLLTDLLEDGSSHPSASTPHSYEQHLYPSPAASYFCPVPSYPYYQHYC